MTLGRSSDCDIQLPFDVVSSHHLTFERDGPDYRVRDEGSTNGLKIDDQWIEAESWQPVRDGMTLQIVDVRLEVGIEESLTAEVDELTLAQTGTLARELLGDALEDDSDDLAYVEIVDGPGTGRRVELPDDIEDGAIGTGPDCFVQIPETTGPEQFATISYAREGFVVRPSGPAPVEHNGAPIDGDTALSDGDSLRVGACQFTFVDPLESQLDDIGGLDGVPAHGTTPADDHEASRPSGENPPEAEEAPAPRSEPKPDGGSELDLDGMETGETGDTAADPEKETGSTPSGRWGLLETVLLLVTVLLVLLVVLVLLVTFEII